MICSVVRAVGGGRREGCGVGRGGGEGQGGQANPVVVMAGLACDAVQCGRGAGSRVG